MLRASLLQGLARSHRPAARSLAHSSRLGPARAARPARRYSVASGNPISASPAAAAASAIPTALSNANYLEDLFSAWQKDASVVHPSLSQYFAEVSNYARGTAGSPVVPGVSLSASPDSNAMAELIRDHVKVVMLIRGFQVRGHHLANIDPLNFVTPKQHDSPPPPELQLSYYGFTEADLSRSFYVGTGAMAGFLSTNDRVQTLGDILKNLRECYCGSTGYEYMHIGNREQCDWLRARIERPTEALSKEEKMHVFDRLAWASMFEGFLAKKMSREKRFGLEGCEVLIPGMKSLIDSATTRGVESVVIGMAHRGRLNVLANVIRKPIKNIFSEFKGFSGQTFGSGDVKYHLGMSTTRTKRNGQSVHMVLMPNPSHLEAVNPVVEGKTRAKQDFLGETGRTKAMSILIHGDAAFSGQGVVYETMGLSDLHDYTTGGTVHIVINNQIGFTADPRTSRSSPYCSDLAKAFQAPIFHVNGDDPEAVVKACRLAAEWRQTFHKDVVIDIVCYRRHGHNESDEPMFTQPLMYKLIKDHVPTLNLYAERLQKEGVLDEAGVNAVYERIENILQEQWNEGFGKPTVVNEWLASGEWLDMTKRKYSANTGISVETFKKIGQALTTVPQEFDLHRTLRANVMKSRKEMVESGMSLDWGMAEALAFGSLLMEGTTVRLSGQDVERGTFSHRHAKLIDQTNENVYIPLNNLDPKQAKFSVSNSSLSEFGVLGFELGYSLESPYSLVLWEAQFGDFANTAQVVFDQFVFAQEAKWMRQSALTCLLPHGYEGQGPEHSSARVERYLQMIDEDPDTFQSDPEAQLRKTNVQIAMPTVPGSYFHLLRRQTHRNYRKPLMVITPKSLLRHRYSVSDFDEIKAKTQFAWTLPGPAPDVPADKVRKVVICAGKVYVDLVAPRFDALAKQSEKDPPPKPGPLDVAFVRLEQLAPFPFQEVAQHLQKYPKAEVIFCQEEPKNMGPWQYVQPRLQTVLRQAGDSRTVSYIGRPSSASPATGFKASHEAEVNAITSAVWA